MNIDSPYEYRALKEFRAGDTIHRWGDNLVVESVDPLLNNQCRLVYLETDGTPTFFVDSADAQFLALKRGGTK